MQSLSHAMTNHLVADISDSVVLWSKHFFVLLKTSLMEIETFVVPLLCFEHITQPVENFASSEIISFAFPNILNCVNLLERLCIIYTIYGSMNVKDLNKCLLSIVQFALHPVNEA